MWWLSGAIEPTKTQVEGIKSATLPWQQTLEGLELIQHNPTPLPHGSCFLLLFQDWHQQHLCSTSVVSILRHRTSSRCCSWLISHQCQFSKELPTGQAHHLPLAGFTIGIPHFFIAWKKNAPVDQSGTWYGRHWNLNKNCPTQEKSMQEEMQSHITKNLVVQQWRNFANWLRYEPSCVLTRLIGELTP